MFKPNSLIKSQRTGFYRVVVEWPLLLTPCGFPITAAHDQWALIGNNLKYSAIKGRLLQSQRNEPNK